MISIETLRSVTDQIQVVITAVVILMLFVPIVVAVHWPKTRPFAIPTLLVAIPSLVFYSIVISIGFAPGWGNFWSSILRLFTLTVILGTFVALAASTVRLQSVGADGDG